MQTTFNIDDKLFEEAAELSATENQSQLIEIALSEFIKNHQQAQNVMCVIWSVKLKLLLIMTTRNCVQANNKHDLILLHSDKDFEHIAEIISALKLYNA